MRDRLLTNIVTPSWYYGLRPTDAGNNPYFISTDFLTNGDRKLFDEPTDYSTHEVELLDLAYQAWLKGVIAEGTKSLDFGQIHPTNRDQYVFLRRHFSSVWSVFALIVRLAELNNPITELRSFVGSVGTRRIDPYAMTKDWRPALAKFDSDLLNAEPKVSVIIPTLNRYKYLKDVLRDLEKQDYTNFEVIVVDQSEPFDRSFYDEFALDLRVVHQIEKAQWLARNSAIQNSKGELILLFDDDSRVEPNWIRSHIKCLDFFKADISSGVSLSAVGAAVPKTYSYYKWGDQLDTGNAMVRKDVFRAVGLFDRQFEKQRQGDGEFGLRAYLAGFKNISNPDASRLHLKAAEGGLRELGSWDGWRPKNFIAPRPFPSVLYSTRKYFGNRAAIYQILQSTLPSLVPYRFKGSQSMRIVGSILGVFILPLISISVMRSWRLSTKKLEEGPKITNLE